MQSKEGNAKLITREKTGRKLTNDEKENGNKQSKETEKHRRNQTNIKKGKGT